MTAIDRTPDQRPPSDVIASLLRQPGNPVPDSWVRADAGDHGIVEMNP